MIEQPNFNYSFLGKAFEKQTITIEEQRRKTNKGTGSAWKAPN